ncbi:MAG: hypothetical protein U1F66_10630 [bacterium]
MGELIKKSQSIAPVKQGGGNYERVVQARRLIGLDRRNAKPTSIYTVITNSKDELITAFPGKP